MLITDNRTREYQIADAATQRNMSRMAWGDSPAPVDRETDIFPIKP